MYPERMIEQSEVCAACVSNKVPNTRRSMKFRKSTSRIKIEMSSTPIDGFLRPPHSILMDGSYSKWVDILECKRPNTYKIRGYDRPIPGIISGHFDMYEREKQSRRRRVKLEAPRMTLSEPRKKEMPDSKVVLELEEKLEKRNASILGKIIPFMVDMFANFSFHDKNEKKEGSQLPPPCQDENFPLSFANVNDYVYPYSCI